MITPANPLAGGATGTAPTPGRGMNDLGATDFLRLLTVQVQQQDPFEPVDNTAVSYTHLTLPTKA